MEANPNFGEVVYRTYVRRYWILTLIGLLQAVIYFQHLQFSTIGDVINEYYGVNYISADATTLIWNFVCILMFYPCGRLIDKYGLRTSLVVGTAINALGAALKCMAIRKYLFWLLTVAQILPASVTLIFLSVVPVMANAWFKPNEVATVFGIANAFLTLGIAIAFLPPRLLFNNQNSIAEIKYGLSLLTITTAVISTVCVILTLIIVKDKPSTPPSLAAEKRNTQQQPFSHLLRNKNLWLLLLAFACSNGIIQVFDITYNQTLMKVFDNDDTVLTIAGVLLVAAGIPGSIVSGAMLTCFPRYRLVNIAMGVLITLSIGLFLWSLKLRSVMFLYTTSFAIGFICSGSTVVVTDYIIEVTYPFPESVAFGFAITGAFTTPIIVAPIVSHLITNYGAINGNFLLLAMALLNLVISLFVTEDLRRRKANTKQLLIEGSNDDCSCDEQPCLHSHLA